MRLSERNVVELVAKLRALGLLGEELLYTTSGKEYVTRERAAAEVRAAVRAAGGRIPLVSAAGGWRGEGGCASAYEGSLGCWGWACRLHPLAAARRVAV